MGDAMSDDIIFSEQGVTIDRSLARFGGITYSISNINSVFIANGGSPAILLWVVAVIVGLIGLNSFSNFLTAIVLLLVAGGIGYAAYKSKRKQVLMLKTSSGDQQAFTTTDADLAGRMKVALEQAISKR